MTETRIDTLPQIIAALPHQQRALVEGLFQVVVSAGDIVPTPEMAPWLERTFGSVEVTKHQQVVRVTNRWTFEGATFNSLRGQRPGSGTTATSAASGPKADPPELRERIERASGDDFCDPEHRTPADTFGRVQGKHVLTASNVAKADGWHGVGVFDRHDPLAIDAALVHDILEVSGEWAHRAQQADPAAHHLFVLWNCLWRAGASLIHGHVQMTLSQVMAHARVESLRAAAERYRREVGGDYFADLAEAHRVLGLSANSGEEQKVEWFASLTPIKEREIVLMAPTYAEGRMDPAELAALGEPLFATLQIAMQQMGVRAFNVAAFGPPLTGSTGVQGDWSGFPMLARFVDRGNPLSPTSDIAGLELFGSSVVSTDPFAVARALQAAASTASDDGADE